jgi:hypothetical protein
MRAKMMIMGMTAITINMTMIASLMQAASKA